MMRYWAGIWQRQFWRFGLGLAFGISGAILSGGDRVLAQSNIVPDGTLGNENSVVINNFLGAPIEVIAGGAARETNLFHSFQEFNVSEGRGAYFFSPSADIQNILARVTGNNRSEILGTLGTFGRSAPNLFLINPNGIIFGPNASLDVGGSFVATTANTIRLGNTGLFSASEPQTSNLLTINPSALFFNAISRQQIVNQSTATTPVLGFFVNEPRSPALNGGLQVVDGRSLSLVGGDVVLEGGNLTAAGGRIDLGSVAGTGAVSINPTNKGLAFEYEGIRNFGTIQLSQFSFVDASGEGGGEIQIQSNRLLAENALILSNTREANQGGDVLVRASDAIVLDNSVIAAGVLQQATGNGGNLLIETGQFTAKGDFAVVSVTTFGGTNSGNLTVKAGQLSLTEGAQFTADTRGSGKGGNLTVETGRLLLADGARLTSDTFSTGIAGDLTVSASDTVEVIGSTVSTQVGEGASEAGGNLKVDTNRLIIQNGGQINAGTFGEGRGGTLTVNASDSVEVIGTDGSGRPSGLFTATYGAGDTGDLTINTRRLSVRDGGTVSSSTAALLGKGRGGNLTINASDSVEVSGSSGAGDDKFDSSLLTETGRLLNLVTGVEPAPGGNLTITTGRLSVSNGAVVSTSSFGLAGNAGDLTITAPESVELIGGGLRTRTASAGNAGDLQITTGQLTVRDGAQVAVNSIGLKSGKAGNLEVTAKSILLNNQGKLIAQTDAGDGGNISLNVQDLLLMRHNSEISTTAGTANQGGNGGNITIHSPFIVAVPREDSDITANAFTGNGGNINITTQGIYGLQFRPRRTPKSDITASSDFGVNGTVLLNSAFDVTQSVTNLPVDLVDASNQIDQTCTPAGAEKRERNRFINTGRGGLPPNPNEPLQGESVITNWVTLEPQEEQQSQNITSGDRDRVTSVLKTPALVEAQGWIYGSQGEVILTAQAPSVTPHSFSLTPSASCNLSSSELSSK